MSREIAAKIIPLVLETKLAEFETGKAKLE